MGLHGTNGNRTQLLPFARFLVDAGHGMLMINLRARGRSEGSLFPDTEDSADLRTAVRYLQGQPDVKPDRIGGIGLSLGAHVLPQPAAGEPALRALVVDRASNNRIEDLMPLPAEFCLMYAASPMWWTHDRFAQLFSGNRAKPFKELVTGIAPRPIPFIASSTDPEPFANRRYATLAGQGAELWEAADSGCVGGLFLHPDKFRRLVLDFFHRALLHQC